jgi:hypothetical protein
MNPSFEDEAPVNPFDLWEGANFRLKIRQFEGYANYDKSEFDSPSALFDDDDKLEAVWKQEHSLQELLAAKNFKSYDELQAKLHRVLGITGDTTKRANAAPSAEADLDEELDMSNLGKTEEPKAHKEQDIAPAMADEDDSDLEFFRALAKS